MKKDDRRKSDRRQTDRRQKQMPVSVDRRQEERRTGLDRRRKQYQKDLSLGFVDRHQQQGWIVIQARSGTITLVPSR